jgi:protein-S-isoprenylcysteine O-methyltransferase Ste14
VNFRELREREVRGILLLRTWVNKGKKKGRSKLQGVSLAKHPVCSCCAPEVERFRMPNVGIEVGERGELHMLPAIAWAASFGVCALGDVMLGRWTLLPLFAVSFYGGTFIIALVTYPLLSFWRSWLKRRGLIAWYLIEVGRLWGGTTLVLLVLSPWWLIWSWSETSSLQVLGCVLFVVSVVAGTWALAKMGWARLLLAGALFPPGAGAEESVVEQRLVVEGPYRYVRNPLYDGDFCLIVGAALLTRSWALVLVAAFYLAQLALQLPMEERELRERFGAPYRRYCELVPRFVPRRRPVRQRDLQA